MSQLVNKGFNVEFIADHCCIFDKIILLMEAKFANRLYKVSQYSEFPYLIMKAAETQKL